MATSNKLLRKITTSSSLPEEIIYDILSRVSAEDLARFRSVSKPWLCLISNPSFTEAFLARSQEEIIYTISKKSIGRIKTQFECNHISMNLPNNMRAKNLRFAVKHGVERNELRLMSACNGLLLFRHIYDPNQIYISNPVTAQFVALPPAKYFRIQWALVHDASIDKYKVYGVCTQKKLLLLTQGESDWVEADIPATTIRGQLRVLTQLIVVNNELHWLSIDIDHDARPGAAANQRYRRVSYYIFSIHIETGVFKRTKVPPYLANPDLRLRFKSRKGRHRHLLSKVEASLCLTIVSCNQLEMFHLEDKLNGVWIKTQKVCLQSLLIGKPSTFLKSFLSNEVCLVPSRDITGGSNSLHLLMNILIHHEDHLFFCDLESLQWRKIAFLPEGEKLSRLYEFHCNSLASWD